MNIYKALLFTALLLTFEVIISLSIGYLVDTRKFELESLRHYFGIIGIVPYVISFLIVFLILKFKVNWNNGIDKFKSIKGNIILYLFVLNIGMFFFDRPSFDFSRILDSINNVPIEPYQAKERNFVTMAYKSISVLIVAPVFEELFFRKYMFLELGKKYSTNISILISSICFSLIHLPNFRNLIPTFLFGVIGCIIYSKTRNIIYTIILHFLLNLTWIWSIMFGEKFYQWLYGLEFNFIYWSLVILGFLIVIFGIRKVTTANNVYS